MATALEVFSDLSERLRYNLPDFPLYVRKGVLKEFDGYAAACHWHPDLEFISVLDGTMNYFINGRIEVLNRGEGIFVNSQRLHYGFSARHTDCVFLVVAVHPSLLYDANLEMKSCLKKNFGPRAQDYLVLHPERRWQGEVLGSLANLYHTMQEESQPLLRMLASAVFICSEVSDHLLEQQPRLSSIDKTWMTVWKMRSFIHHYYCTKISLDDVAASGAVCRSRCCQLFAQQVGQSPTVYLSHYRINKSCEMLRETDRSVIEIALACGFQSPSYFAAAFRSEMGMSPSAYRSKTRL
jgi:AraC-type DNA-binding domain-containing proteins